MNSMLEGLQYKNTQKKWIEGNFNIKYLDKKARSMIFAFFFSGGLNIMRKQVKSSNVVCVYYGFW